jgi:hypothetical protein
MSYMILSSDQETVHPDLSVGSLDSNGNYQISPSDIVTAAVYADFYI